jgi:hypothetical protein
LKISTAAITTSLLPLDWAEKAGAFWIILSLVSGRMDHGPIRFEA